jgi:hypothetical protein
MRTVSISTCCNITMGMMYTSAIESRQASVSSRQRLTNSGDRPPLQEVSSSQLGNHSAWPTRNYSVSKSFLLSSVLVHHLNHLADTALPYSSRQGTGTPSRAPTSRSEGQVVCEEEDRLEEDCRKHDDGERQQVLLILLLLHRFKLTFLCDNQCLLCLMMWCNVCSSRC